MKLMRQPTRLVLLALLLVPTLLFSQEQPAQHGSVEFGVRHVRGDVYGRPDLPFTPDPITSKFNEYSDYRSGFVVRKFYANFDDILGSKNYVTAQSQSTFYKNQSYLATFGRYGKFRLQFRYDEIPHVYTNTARSLYVQTSPGVFTILPATKQILQDRSSTVCATPPCTAAQIIISLPGFIATQVVPGENFILPEIRRKAGTGLFTYNVTPDWNFNFLFWRENQVGTRPIGLILNPSPSASASGQPQTTSGRQSPGTGAELPEPIDYFNNTVKVGTEYGKKNWAFQLGYTGSFFQNNIGSLLFDNPFATADVPVQIIPPGGGCTPTAPAVNCAIGAVPAQGQVDVYPNNQAHYLNFAGAFDLGKYVRVMGTVNPGWLRQNDPFLPYSANSQIFFPDSTGALTIPATTLSLLPAPSLNGQKQTLAMNWTLIASLVKDVQLAAKYRHYDYNNNTAVFTLTPILGDTIGANSTATAQLTPGTAASGSGAEDSTVGRSNIGFNKKTLELSGNWFFAKRSSAKVGWEGEWFDRSHRDADHSFENSVFAAVDLSPRKDLLFRLAYRHSDRKPESYQDEAAVDPATETLIECTSTSTAFTEEQRCHRRFDEAARLLNRADATMQYNLQKFTFTGGFQTIQQDFNRPGGTNSPTALNFLTGAAATTGPYYLYGALKDLSYIYTFDASYALSPEVSLFGEYTHERYHKRMISRSRTPTSGTQTILTCNGCDTANNDWESTYRDIFDTYAAGVDLYLVKKAYLTTYYSLSAGKGNVFSRFLGDPTILAPATTNRFVLVGTSAALDYPETTTRIHELVAVFKYKLTKNIMPKLEYRYQQFDNKDFQTSPMTPYMGCISPATGTLVNGCPVRQLTGSTSPNPTFTASPFYPGFVVGDTSSARYLFLGVDQPSYRVHVFTATLEYRF
ncbi:MAG: MtrB/PioB family outer membrane beta-barrel protein [Acidobacteria bacterium]|nr:MtrB/PioB family outer membrane beta-barrel protein [Acidobacteriota bacterium]